MKTNRLAGWLLGLGLLGSAPTADAAVYTVTSAADSGVGTLRWALSATATNPGADVVRFNLPAPYRIQPTSPLPVIFDLDPVTVDGASQPGFSGLPLVTLDGSAAGVASGFAIIGSTTTVIQALNVVNWTTGIQLQHAAAVTIANCTIWSNVFDGVSLDDSHDCFIGGGMALDGNRIGYNGECGINLFNQSSGNLVLGNWIGNDGTMARPNEYGVQVLGAPGNQIGGAGPGQGNLIGGNAEYGVWLQSGASNTVVVGNWIGVDETGTAALGNTIGVSVWGASNRIGGTVAAERNLISGNVWGMRLLGTNARRNVIEGNWVGLGAAVSPVPNGYGVQLIQGAASNRVGGSGAGARNVVSGNTDYGITIADTNSSGNRILGNYLGVDLSGTIGMGNGGNGLTVSRAPGTIIGGGGAGEGNLISANGGDGIALANAECTGTEVKGNRIGVGASGLGRLGNGGCGIRISDAPTNRIGSAVPGEANDIAHSGSDGILVTGGAAVGNRIGINRIHSNAKLGIDLDGNGVSLNDPLDADVGPNRLQNYPVLVSVSNNGTHLVVRGSLSAQPLSPYRLNFYANGNCDASGHGEGETFLGDLALSTDAAGFVAFTNSTIVMPVPPPNFVTATAQHEGTLDTSEFSAYAMLDSDGDGMPDGWEDEYFGSATGGDPAGQADADGTSNLDEFIADTDPTDADSRPPQLEIRRSGEDFELSIATSASRRYWLDDSEALDKPNWACRFPATPGTGSPASWPWSMAVTSRYFRCRVARP
jgi:hypothetical protein